MRGLALLLCVLVLSPAAMATAADVRQTMDQADELYNSGDKLGALDRMRQAVMGLWSEVPLSARNIHFVTDPPEGFGMYEPVAKAVFDALDPVHLYFEPVGGTVKKESGFFKMALAAGFQVKDLQGNVLGGQDNIQTLETTTRSFSSEVMMTLTFNFKGLPSGQYILAVTLRDGFSNKTATFEEPFGIQ